MADEEGILFVYLKEKTTRVKGGFDQFDLYMNEDRPLKYDFDVWTATTLWNKLMEFSMDGVAISITKQ